MFSVDNKIEDYILKRLSNYDLSIVHENDEIEIRAAEESLYNILSFLQHDTHCQFDQLLDLIVLDRPCEDLRFNLIYIVRSLKNNQKIRVLTSIASETLSVAEIYRNASWLEREAWEMFGIFFKNSRDLRRLLTDFTYGSHPLRKDYPPHGWIDYIFDNQRDKFFSVPVSLLQEYRVFNIKSPWKGPESCSQKKESLVGDVPQEEEVQVFSSKEESN